MESSVAPNVAWVRNRAASEAVGGKVGCGAAGGPPPVRPPLQATNSRAAIAASQTGVRRMFGNLYLDASPPERLAHPTPKSMAQADASARLRRMMA